MMSGLHIYRNTRTGVCIQTPCVCAGEDWEEVVPAASDAPAPAPEPAAPPKNKNKSRK